MRKLAAPPRGGLGASAQACAYIHTAQGVISIRLRPSAAPKTVDNFVGLARAGFYDGLTFYRACPDSADPACAGNLAEAGDPTNSGTGGPGYDLPLEPAQGKDLLGAVGMATSGASDSGSRFFISRGDNRDLPGHHNLFGQVVGGLEVLAGLQKGTSIDWVAIQTD